MTAKKTICTICQVAPRDSALKDAHCRACNREKSRNDRRAQRGTDPSLFRATLDHQGTRPHPLGTCYDCGGTVHRNGRCKEHLLAYSRRKGEEARRAAGKMPRAEYEGRAKAKREKPRPVKADPKPKPTPPVKTRPVVPDVPIEIGQQVFAKPASVAGKAQRIAYVSADDVAREAEMVAWFRGRGL